VDPVSSARHEGGSIPHIRRNVAAPPGGAPGGEDWHGANQAKLEKLRRNSLQRRAGANGLDLRHSAYGYALIDSARNCVDDRQDMTLDEVESWLERG
jgi:hypothetical protein